MANLGDVGLACGISGSIGAYGLFGLETPSVSVDITATSSVPGSRALLMRNGVQIYRTISDATTGVWHFYNVDDSGSQPYTVMTTTQAGGGTGEVWTATVSGATVTVSKVAEYVRSYGSVSSG